MKIRYLHTSCEDIFLTSRHNYLTSKQKKLTSQHEDLISRHNYLTSDGRNMPTYMYRSATIFNRIFPHTKVVSKVVPTGSV